LHFISFFPQTPSTLSTHTENDKGENLLRCGKKAAKIEHVCLTLSLGHALWEAASAKPELDDACGMIMQVHAVPLPCRDSCEPYKRDELACTLRRHFGEHPSQ
jgi:hypothetical protein